MIRSLRLGGRPEEIAAEVGLYDVLDLEIGGPEAHGEMEMAGTAMTAREQVSLPGVDAMTMGGGDDGTMAMVMEPAPETPPLPFTSSSTCPIPQPGSPPPAPVKEAMSSREEMAPGPARPPLATSLTDLACLLSWGAGGEYDPQRQ